MKRVILSGLFSGILLAQTGQQTGGTAPVTTGNTGTSTTTRPTTTTIPTTTTPSTNTQQPSPDMQRPIFLSGRVMMDDGTAPPQSVIIERVCNGNPKPEGYTDSKGYFSFQLGQNNNMLMDATMGGAPDSFGNMSGGIPRQSGMGSMGGGTSSSLERQLQNCDLRANLAGFRSDLVSLAGRRMMDNPDIGTIVLRRLTGNEGLTTSFTSMMAPKDAKKAYEKGRDLAKKKKYPEAEKEFRKAVDSYPKYASAWYDLGLVQEGQDNLVAAHASYEQAIVADAKFLKPYTKIYNLDARLKKWDEVALNSGKVIKMNPFEFPDAYFVNAIANLNLKKYDEAEASARAAIKMDTAKREPKLDHVLGVILVQKDDLPGALAALKSFIARAPNDPGIDSVKKQVADIDRFLAAKVEQAVKEEK